jgi:MoaA/NifB/PqqE/SkfB family radical SAM enzyme
LTKREKYLFILIRTKRHLRDNADKDHFVRTHFFTFPFASFILIVMFFDHVKFLSGWVTLENGSMTMDGRKSTLEIENTGGDFLIMEYAYPGREEERGISVSIKIFDKSVGHFRGFYSFTFYIGFKIPVLPQKKLLITIETDHSYFKADDRGERREYGITLLNLELLNKETDPHKYRIFETKVENLKEHFGMLLNVSREAQPLPLALLIEPTSRCNMDCVMCARSIPGHRREDECDLSDEFIPILGKSMIGIQASRIQGLGEPLISKNFVPLMNLLESNHVHIVTFNTNGYLLNEEMARFLVLKGRIFENFRISFSLDAATQKVYYKIRGRDLNRTLKHIRYIQDYKRKMGLHSPRVVINMTLSRTNIADLPRFIRLAHDLDVQVELNNLAVDIGYESIQTRRGSKFLFDYKKEILTAYPELYNKFLKEAERLGKKLNVTIHKAGDVTYMDIIKAVLKLFSPKEVLKNLFKSTPDNTLHREISPSSREKDPYFEQLPLCLLPWSQMVVSSKGDVSLCCVQGYIDHLRNYTSLEEVWNSEKIRRIRELLINGIFPPECQSADCTVRKWNSRVCIIHQ